MSDAGGMKTRWLSESRVLPVAVVLLALLVFWYVMAVVMNAPWQETLNGRANLTDVPLARVRAADLGAGQAGAASAAPGGRRNLDRHCSARPSPRRARSPTMPGSRCRRHAAGLCARHAAGHRPCGDDRPQRCIGPLADAVDHRQPDHPDPRHRADGGGRPRRRRRHRASCPRR